MTSLLGWCAIWLSVILLWIGHRDASVFTPVGRPRPRWFHDACVSLAVFFETRTLFLRTWTHAFAPAWLRADEGEPPGLDTRGPPVACASPWASTTAAGHAGNSQAGPRTFALGNSRPEGAR
jgi:hypothetical protein